MKYIGFILLLVALAGCKQPAEEVVTYPKIDCEAYGYIEVQRWRNEVLSLDSMTINGEFPLVSTIDHYRKEFGSVLNAYSIQEEDVALYGSRYSDSNKKTRYAFRGALVDTWGDQAIINTLDLDLNDVEIVHPSIVLKKGMPVSELNKLFPASCQLISIGGNLWSGFIILHASFDASDWRRVVLLFQGEELIKIRIVNFEMRER